jgi:hypothetical protein
MNYSSNGIASPLSLDRALKAHLPGKCLQVNYILMLNCLVILN